MQNPFAVVTGFLFDLLLVNGEVLPLIGLEIFPVALVANQILVAPLELFSQVRDDGLPVSRVLAPLFFIQADDVAAALEDHFLDFQG